MVGHHGCFCPDDGRSDSRENRVSDPHRRRDLPEGAPHGIEPAGKKDPGRLIGRTKGGMNKKVHAVTDRNERPLNFFVTAGQVSDYTGGSSSS